MLDNVCSVKLVVDTPIKYDYDEVVTPRREAQRALATSNRLHHNDLRGVLESLESEVRRAVPTNLDQKPIAYTSEVEFVGKLFSCYTGWDTGTSGVSPGLDVGIADRLQGHHANHIVYRAQPAVTGGFCGFDLETIDAGNFEAAVKEVELAVKEVGAAIGNHQEDF